MTSAALRRLYVSDTHLTPGNSSADQQRLTAFCQLLRSASQDAVDEIYLLGDLFEMWIGDDDDSDLANTIAELLQTITQRTRVNFLAGNRDFLLGSGFADRTGLTLIQDPHALGTDTLLSHGDSLCTDDLAYQQMRTLLRSAEWQKDILDKSLEERRAFGAGLREQSQAANANKAGNIMDVNDGAVSQMIGTHGAKLFIHGHTHRPAKHSLSGGEQRVVLGAWERCAWWALQEGQKISLRCAGMAWLATSSQQKIINAKAFAVP